MGNHIFQPFAAITLARNLGVKTPRDRYRLLAPEPDGGELDIVLPPYTFDRSLFLAKARVLATSTRCARR